MSAISPYVHLRDRSYLMQPFQFLPDQHKKVIYEITLEIDEDIKEEYLDWLRGGHIQEALGELVGWLVGWWAQVAGFTLPSVSIYLTPPLACHAPFYSSPWLRLLGYL